VKNGHRILLHNYLKLENPKTLEPLEQERWVRGSIEDLNLRGILDRMDEDKDGNLVIVDYKSGKSPLAKYKEPRFFALKLYALLIRDELGVTPVELKLIYLKNKIWEDIKKAFEENNFPATKNNLCKDWCYYKPICPLFNDDAPNTDSLQKIEDRILELNETLEAVNMFENQNELPDSSPLKEVDVKKLNEELDLLNIEKNSLLDDITKLLGK